MSNAVVKSEFAFPKFYDFFHIQVCDLSECNNKIFSTEVLGFEIQISA